MRNYKITIISSIGKSLLVDPENNVYYFLMGNTYFAKEAREFRTVEDGLWYHLDRRYILCSEDVMHHIYE